MLGSLSSLAGLPWTGSSLAGLYWSSIACILEVEIKADESSMSEAANPKQQSYVVRIHMQR